MPVHWSKSGQTIDIVFFFFLNNVNLYFESKYLFKVIFTAEDGFLM